MIQNELTEPGTIALRVRRDILYWVALDGSNEKMLYEKNFKKVIQSWYQNGIIINMILKALKPML